MIFKLFFLGFCVFIAAPLFSKSYLNTTEIVIQDSSDTDTDNPVLSYKNAKLNVKEDTDNEIVNIGDVALFRKHVYVSHFPYVFNGTIDWSLGNRQMIIAENVSYELVFSNPPYAGALSLLIDHKGPATITLPDGIYYPQYTGSPVDLTIGTTDTDLTATKFSILTLMFDGENYFLFSNTNYSKY